MYTKSMMKMFRINWKSVDANNVDFVKELKIFGLYQCVIELLHITLYQPRGISQI